MTESSLGRPATSIGDPARILSSVQSDGVYDAVAQEALGIVRSALAAAKAEARLRVTTLPGPVMERVCAQLQGDDRWTARMLTAGAPSKPWEATATKLIELRNNLPEPLLVCIPPGLRTAAEDSLDIATFGELALPDLIARLGAGLLSRLDSALRPRVADALTFLGEQKVLRGSDAVIEYLLTVLANGADPAAAGGALYVFGLIPDFDLFTRGGERVWLDRNIKASITLSDAGQPLQTRLARLKVEPNTIQPALFSFLRTRRVDTVREWGAEIACSDAARELSFDRWSFADAQNATQLRIVLDPLALPRQVIDDLGGAMQLPILDLQRAAGLKVSFKATPPPAQLPAWKHFRVQILSVAGADGQPSVAWESNSYAKSNSRQSAIRRTIKRADLDGLEEGTYFLRVEAYDDGGAVLLQPRRIDPSNPQSRYEHESDVFLITRGESAEPEQEPTRAIFATSLFDGWLLAASRGVGQKKRTADYDEPDRSSVAGAWQEPIGAALKGDVHFQLEGAGLEGYAVVLPSVLRRLELDILRNPEALSGLQLDLSTVRTISDAEVVRRPNRGLADQLSRFPEGADFLATRGKLFDSISSQHLLRMGESGESAEKIRKGIVETVDLTALAGTIGQYADAFIALIEALTHRDSESTERNRQDVELLRQLASLDTVEVRWRRSVGDPGRAMLLAPTHPLRVAWHVQYAAVSSELLEGWRAGSVAGREWRAVLDRLRHEVLPLNLPMVIFDSHGRAYVEHVPLTTHWALYLPDRTASEGHIDAAACRDTMRQLMGMRGRALAIEPVGAEDLAALMFDYVQQHPYTEQLRLNVFNPGDGELIAEALRKLERKRKALSSGTVEPPQLRYAVQLFGSGERLEALGRGFESLLDPDRQVEEDDEFTLMSANHLLPKLVFARNAVSEFIRDPHSFPAHISVFYEQFGVRGRLGSIAALRRGSFVKSLVHEPETTPEEQSGSFGWFRGLLPVGSPLGGRQERTLDGVLATMQRLQAIAAAGEIVPPDVAPVVAVQLNQESQALLRQAHDVSDWVLTIDRNIGLEYFDSPSSIQECGYLLDFSPEFLQSDRQRLLLTTRRAEELDALVRPALEHLGLSVQPGDELPVLDALRSMSGRLALRLLASGTRVSEIGGLLLARWLLEQVGVLKDRLVIPVDAHPGWFSAMDDSDGPAGVTTSRRRADLLVIGLTPERRLVDVAVVEVKWRESLSSSERSALYRSMREQAENTEKRIRERFDLDFYGMPRADSILQTKELATLLAFYTRRASRYGLLSGDTAQAALDFVQNLDAGYRLDVRSLGVVFERQGQGVHVDEEEFGFAVHRFGLDVANRLLTQARQAFVVNAGGRADAEPGIEESAPRAVVDPMSVSEGDASARERGPLLDSFRSAVSGGESTAITQRPAEPVIPSSGLPVQPRREGGSGGPTAPGSLGMGGSVVKEPESASDGASQDGLGAPDRPSIALKDGADKASAAESAQANEVEPIGEPQVSPATAPPAIRVEVADGSPTQGPALESLVGANEMTPQYGVIGRSGTGAVALDLTGCNTISLFGVQGFGKSYTLGVISEMATTQVDGINLLPSPLATVIFHYHKSDSYAPEMAAAVAPNGKAREIEQLLADYRARPTGLRDVVLLSPEARVADRRQEFPELTVLPIKFSSGELGAEGWKFLLGAVGSDALYVRQLVAIMRKYRHALTLDEFRREIEAADLSPAVRRLAEDRLNLAAPYLDDSARLEDLLRPGRTVIVDLRDEWVEKDEALGLFVVMLRIFAKARHQGHSFNKLVVFDEAHKYITDSELVGQVVETIREMRHQATSVVIASQDPLSVPRAVVELTSVLLLHRMTSPQWLKHLKGAIGALDQVTEAQLASLQPGEALLWAQRSTDKRYSQRPQRIRIRPRFSQHGGGTKTAVSGATVR